MVGRTDIPIGGLLLLFLLGDITIATLVNAQGDEAGGVVVGLVFSQIVLFATWTALGPTSVFKRAVSGMMAATLVALALVACIRNSGANEDRLLWFGIVMTQWMVIQIPLWVLRLFFGWRLAWPGEQSTASSRSDNRFGIRQLMAWTAVVAMTLGIGRWLLPGDGLAMLGGTRQFLIGFCLITVFNCLLAWPVIWAMLARSAWEAWIVVAFVCCVGLTIAEDAALSAVMGRGSSSDFIWIMNAVQTVGAAISLLAIRMSGFRMIRIVEHAD